MLNLGNYEVGLGFCFLCGASVSTDFRVSPIYFGIGRQLVKFFDILDL